MNHGIDPIVQAAKDEFLAWTRRNKAKKELKAFYREYTHLCGEFFDRDLELANDDDYGYVDRFDPLMSEYKAAQKDLTLKRNKTRRLIKKDLEKL